MSKNDNVMLSIYVSTYGQEEYIALALDSILMQKTSYTYEVLVGEDASPDGTREILKEYEKKYPNKFKMFYRPQNMYGKIYCNSSDLRERCVGKYVICLEGDDYWTSDTKIEKQVSFLEEHPEYIAVSHNCIVVDENNDMLNEKYPECKDEIYSLNHYVSEILPGQTTTLMVRNYTKENLFDTSILNFGLIPGDRLLYFALSMHGRIYCMQETMSAYRHVLNGGSSFSANYKYNFYQSEKWHAFLMEYTRKFDMNTPKEYSEMLYFRNICYGIKTRQLKYKHFLQYFNKIDNRGRSICLYVQQFINHKLLHKKLWL